MEDIFGSNPVIYAIGVLEISVMRLIMFSLIRTNGWENNRDAGDLIRHHAHYYVTVMLSFDVSFLFVWISVTRF